MLTAGKGWLAGVFSVSSSTVITSSHSLNSRVSTIRLKEGPAAHRESSRLGLWGFGSGGAKGDWCRLLCALVDLCEFGLGSGQADA